MNVAEMAGAGSAAGEWSRAELQTTRKTARAAAKTIAARSRASRGGASVTLRRGQPRRRLKRTPGRQKRADRRDATGSATAGGLSQNCHGQKRKSEGGGAHALLQPPLPLPPRRRRRCRADKPPLSRGARVPKHLQPLPRAPPSARQQALFWALIWSLTAGTNLGTNFGTNFGTHFGTNFDTNLGR